MPVKKLSTICNFFFTRYLPSNRFSSNAVEMGEVSPMKTKDVRKSDTRDISSKAPKRNIVVHNPREEAEYFGEQYCSTVQLEPPEPLLRVLATAVVEVMAGVRNINQLGSLLSEDVFLRLRERSIRVAQLRARNGEPARAPQLSVSDLHVEHPRDGVVESVVLVHSPSRTRAVTIRLEGVNRRWRAQAVSVI